VSDTAVARRRAPVSSTAMAPAPLRDSHMGSHVRHPVGCSSVTLAPNDERRLDGGH
jgi:hypothetical protein